MHLKTIKQLTTKEVVAQNLVEPIMELDKQNMAPIFEHSGKPFPEEKRRKGFENDGVFFIVFGEKQRILGYLQFCRDWRNPEGIYIGSLQIDRNCRNGVIFKQLIAEGIRWLRQQTFRNLKSHVQKSNRVAVRLYEKLGFSISESPNSNETLEISAEPSIAFSSLANRLQRSRQK